MRRPSRDLLIFVLLLAGLAFGTRAEPAADAWPQWGGPERDFTAAAGELTTEWPAEGPKELWLRWHLTLGDDAITTMSTQLWGDDHVLFGSSAYADGSRGIKVTRKADGTFAAEEVWYTRKMRVHHGTAVRIGGHVYGSSGDFGPAFLAAVDAATGDGR